MASRKFAFGFPDITLVTIFAWDRVDDATSLIFRYWVFRFRKQLPDGLMWFLSNFEIRLIGSDVPLIYGKIQKPFAASGVVVDSW